MSDSALVDAVLQPVRGHMAFESCVEQLGSAIQLGVFREGSRLPNERDLAGRLNVSRATLREAISALRSAGFVTTSRGRGGGTVVESLENAQPFDRTRNRDRQEEIDDILIFRSIIEPGASFRAASTKLPEESQVLLRTCLADFDEHLAPADYRQADARLHLAIASVSGSRRLAKASSTIQTKIHHYLAEIPFLQTNIVNSDVQHRQIIEAILEGDAGTARSVMEEHCGATAALLNGLLK